MVHEHIDEHTHEDNATYKTITAILGLAVFFVIGWIANDAYQGAFQTGPTNNMQFGIGGSPVNPTPSTIRDIFPTEPVMEEPTAVPSPATEPSPTDRMTPLP